MKYILLGLCFAWGAQGALAQSLEVDRLYKLRCASCHGQHGDKVDSRMSVAASSLSKEDIVARLNQAVEADRQSSGERAKASLTPQEAEAIAAYLAEMGAQSSRR